MTITPNQVLQLAANAYNVDPDLLLSGIRTQTAVLPRHIAAYLLTFKLNLSTPKVGQLLGGRDHSTILHALKNIKKIRNEDASFNGLIVSLETQMDMMERLECLGVLNIIEIACHASASRRGAMGLSVHEIMALANSLIETWEITQASGVMCEHIIANGNPHSIRELALNIHNMISIIADTNQTEQEESGHEQLS